MGPVDFVIHLLNFAAPAAAVALAVALGARFIMPKPAPGRGWRAHAAINFAAGLLALGAGLAWFGRDGKMATYAALVGAVALSQWIAGRGWKR